MIMMAAPPQLNSLQHWRQLCYVMTRDVYDTNELLQFIASGVVTSTGAHACTISYQPLNEQRYGATAGTLTDLASAMIEQAETSLSHDQRTPLYQTMLDTTVASIPITAHGSQIGVLHLVHAEDISEADLQVIAVMLANALIRHQTALLAQRAAEREVQQQIAVQQALTRILAESATLSDATPVILQAFCECLGWDIGELWTIDPQEYVLRCTTGWHTPELELHEFIAATQNLTCAPGFDLPGRVWLSEEVHWVSDIVRDTNFPRALLAAKYHLRNALAFPILDDNGLQGVIVLLRRHVRSADHHLIALLTTFGKQIGQFVQRKRAEAAQRAVEQQFRATFEHAPIGIAHVGMDGAFLRVNQWLCDIFGYTQDELLARTFQDVRHADDLEHDFGFARQLLDNVIHSHKMEKRYIRKDGSIVWLHTTVSLIRSETGAPDYFIALIKDITARHLADEEHMRLTAQLRIERDRLLRREVEVRTQIGRDLHDGPVQQVAMAALSTQYVRRVAERAPEMLPQALDDLEDQLQRATQDLRTVLYELRPLGITEEGLVSAIKQYIGKIRAPQKLHIRVDAPSQLRRLASEHEAAMFIIIQEAINNVRKHAAARNIWITLKDDGAALCATVRDDGRGFDVKQTQASYVQRNSFGLLNMAERAQLSGGSCKFESTLGKGSVVHIRIPFTETTVSS